LQTRHWDDNEGNKHTSTEVVANEMIMLSERRDNPDEPVPDLVEDDDYPF
jgi:single-stranded DNA-binding protein